MRQNIAGVRQISAAPGGFPGVLVKFRPRPPLPYYARLSDILQRRLNAALAGSISPEEALAAAEKEMRAVAARYR